MSNRTTVSIRLPDSLKAEMVEVVDHLQDRGLQPDTQTAVVIQALHKFLPQLKSRVASYDISVNRTPPEGYRQLPERTQPTQPDQVKITDLIEQLQEATRGEDNALAKEFDKVRPKRTRFPTPPGQPTTDGGGVYQGPPGSRTDGGS